MSDSLAATANAPAPRKKDADYVFYELTRSICPDCRKVIDAKILLRGNKVYMAKRCPDCGSFESLVYGDAGMYTTFGKYNEPGTIPLALGTEIKDGCPNHGDKVTPLSRAVNVYDYLDYITNGVMPDFSLEIKKALEGLWSSSSVPGSQKSAEQFSVSCQACGLPESLTVGNIAQNMLMIMLQDFMDPWTFDQKNLMKCRKEFLLPGGKQVPFCSYNTIGYREQARKQLEAMEPERRRARRECIPYVVKPVDLNMKGEAASQLTSIDVAAAND